MKAKSDLLTAARQKPASAAAPRVGRRSTVRMPATERREQILSKAFEFFSEYGLTAQTRALAEACGVSQRLLYSVFPSKSALLSAVYEAEIAGVFKAVWFVQLRERSKPIAQRLNTFYREYYDAVLTRRWMRLFLYASLAEVEMASTYISSIIMQLLDTVIEESAHEAGLALPANRAEQQEIAWILHGAISHLAIRRHIYHNESAIPVERVIDLQVRSFLGGLPLILQADAANQRK
ncbi:MAG: TetR/AcrR family transcriptional regulator [Hylemonella sp.]|nr:TetR/AcrR family transcriptional regulator [Hylemonella sp.]